MRLDCGCRKALSFDNVFIKPKRSALPSRDISLLRNFKFKYSKREWEGIPIIAANMDHTGTLAMAKELNMFNCMTALHKFHSTEDLKTHFQNNTHYNTWMSVGMNALDDLQYSVSAIQKINDKFSPNICIDVANGYTEAFVKYVELAREMFPNSTIMAGNVASYEQTEQLIISGADIVKIGIGPGSVCTTRRMTGVGVPQLSAIDECADAAHGLGGMICADGGCRYPGDVAKAYAAGADFVMLGGMLAGHDECAGEYVYSDGTITDSKLNQEHYHDPVGMLFHGMSSIEAQNQHYGGLKSYRAAEGKEVTVDYRGPVNATILDILGGLRSTMTYIGAERLKDIPKCATLVLTNEQLNGSFS